jgi:type VI secretion system protein ImpL
MALAIGAGAQRPGAACRHRAEGGAMTSANLLLGGLLVATLLVVILLAVVVSAALRGGGAAGSTAAVKTLRLLGAESLRLSFRKAVKLVEANLASSAERYNLAWTLLLNDSAGADVPMAESGLSCALSADSSLHAAAQGLAWHFFDKGLVVQLRTQALGADGDGDGVWDALIELCRQYRPQRPFDALVLAISCAALLEDGPQGQRDLVARAQALHRRLWLAQNRLALRFPVHLVVTECEQLPGFASFGAALAPALRRSILGWASPHELAAPFRAQWVDQAMDQVLGAVADSGAELSALEPGEADSRAYLLLPTELERLRAGLKLFCDELMRPSAYHESFLLRGVYLTGDSSPAAVLQAGGAVAADREQAPACLPVFLRDIFERKVFPEVGLVRSSRQRLRRPAARRLAHWVAILVPLAWAGSLLVGAWNLQQKQDELMVWLKGSGQPYRGPAEAFRKDQAQERAVAALEEVDSIGAIRFYSYAMPGSWPLFDVLEAQRHARLEEVFGAHAVEALRAAAVAKLAQLTGAAPDDGNCDLPVGWRELVAADQDANLDLDRLPEYRGLLRYLDGVRDLHQAVRAMRRLAGPAARPATGADLQVAMRILLGKAVPPGLSNAAALYRQAAESRQDLTDAAIGAPVKCTLRMATSALYTRMFESNALLMAERQAGTSLNQLRNPAGATLEDKQAAWENLQKALATEQTLLAQGQGAWMHQEELNLGPAQEALLKRIREERWLGDGVAKDVQATTARGFAGFRQTWNEATAMARHVDGIAGLVWAGKVWAFAPVRKALVDAVTELLAPAYMKPAAPLDLPVVPAGSTIDWDKGQVERAASLADARKGFMAGAYLGLPTALQPAAASVVDARLVAGARNALARAMTVTGPALPGAAADAQRAGVLAIRTWLNDLNARDLVGRLDVALAADAYTRLERLDAVFRAAEVYMPRDPTFHQWLGEKGVMVDAFGEGDGPALDLYLERQKEFVDTIGAQAEGVLNQLVSTVPVRGTLPLLVADWAALRDDLLRYRQKSPASSRLGLETFIRTGSADLELANCADKLAPRPAARRPADLFTERLQVLQSGLLARCRELAGSADQRRWQQFAEAYNRDLAQRAPFGGTPAGPRPVAADRDAVAAALQLYDHARAASTLAGKVAGTPVGAATYRADPQLRRLRDLLAPLFPLDEAQAGGLDVAVEFRANAGAERGANKLIDWTLAVGPATLRLGEAARPLRWEPGMKVMLSLRLASDGGVLPVVEPGRPGMSVTGRTANFVSDDPWALFSFVNAYREPDSAGDDGRAPLLRFPFRLAPAPGAAPVPDSDARVYLRLRVSAPGKLAPLAWPSGVPGRLPLTLDVPKTAYEPTP